MLTNQEITSNTISMMVKPATAPQVEFLVNWVKIESDDAMALSAKEASKLIGSYIKSRRDASRQPPTDAQLRFLEDHGFNRAAYGLRTRGYCSRLIYRIKSGRAA